jgi:hypothetical protein
MIKNAAGQENRRDNIIIPNVNDDNGDGVPDSLAAVLNGTADDDMLQVLVKPGLIPPQGAVVRIEIAEPWTRFARAFIRDSSQGVFQLIQGPMELSPDEATKDGVIFGLEALDASRYH